MITGIALGSLPGAAVAADPSADPIAPGADDPIADLPPVAAGPPAAVTDGPRFQVTNFELQYAQEHAGHPPLAEIREITVELGRAADGFVAPRAGFPAATIRVSDTFSPPDDQFYASALAVTNAALVQELNRRGLVAVLVVPSEDEIAPRTGEDLRPPTLTSLTLVIFTGRAIEVRTFASGGVVPEGEEENHPRHRRILERSPVEPGGENDLIREDLLLEYAARLNRHPGRRVDVQISPARTAGGAYVDYLVTELKPWAAYAQYSNTGTDSTTEWRQRFGFVDYQLSGHDDFLALDYLTGDFDEVHAVSGFYDVPIYGTEWLRARVFGAYNQFDSSIVGFQGDLFHGKAWMVGGQLVANVFQHNEFFVDLIGGLRFMHAEIENDLVDTEGKDDFFIPTWGMRAMRATDRSAVFIRVTFDRNLSDVAGTNKTELQKFGRGLAIDEDWLAMHYDADASFYLEPLIFGDAFNDPSTPLSSTLAHEVYVRGRGQYAFGNRLIPNEMQTLGGLYTVRGYEEAEVAGDSIAMGSVEYRLHIPRLFTPDRTPLRIRGVGPFKVVPQHVYGQPDWDLIFRTFFDIGREWRSDRNPLEVDETLIGSGLGVELLLRQNVSARFDYGWALKDTVSTDAGDGEARFVVRIQY